MTKEILAVARMDRGAPAQLLIVLYGVALALCRGHLGRRATPILLYGTAAYFAYRLLTVSRPGAIHQILVTMIPTIPLPVRSGAS